MCLRGHYKSPTSYSNVFSSHCATVRFSGAAHTGPVEQGRKAPTDLRQYLSGRGPGWIAARLCGARTQLAPTAGAGHVGTGLPNGPPCPRGALGPHSSRGIPRARGSLEAKPQCGHRIRPVQAVELMEKHSDFGTKAKPTPLGLSLIHI